MRMAGAARRIDEKEFVRLWFSDASLAEICETLGITGGSLWHLQNKHRLPARGRPRDTQRRPDDPTPEEIEQRAAECREKRTKEEQARNERIGRIDYAIPAFAYHCRSGSFREMNQ